MTYLLQVQGTFLETYADTVSELAAKGAALKAKHNLSGKTYRVFKKDGLNEHGFANMVFAKEARFS